MVAAGLLVVPCAGAHAQSAPSWFDPTRIDDAPAAPFVRTHHQGVFNGVNLEFDVLTGETVLPDEDDRPATTVFSTAYLRSDVSAPATRPVLFLFNGGPGASSSPLHLGLGPVRRPPSGDAHSLIPNASSVLDATDMVFVDPPGTGYSRLYREGAGEAFWGIEEDADAILYFVHDWLAREQRLDSPLFLMGESYGGTRAVTMLARADNVRFAGVLLLSPGLDYTAGTPVVGNNLPYIFRLPSMAATAAYHGVTERGRRSFGELFEQAADYAQSHYAAALYQGASLGAAERGRVAAELAELTGLSRDYLMEKNLRVTTNAFSDALIGDKGMRVGRLDARITGPVAEFEGLRPPRDDPSMAAGSSGGRSSGELLDEYFRNRLNTDIDRPYRTLNLDLNSKWKFEREDAPRFYLTVVPLLEEAMQEDPRLRVFVGGGVFDLVTPIMAARYATSQVDVPRDRFTYTVYEAGHTVFDHEESRVQLGHDVRAFIAATLAAPAHTPE
ncbi:MAG: S10 family peptidase [Woeseiaceae bacterium]